MVQLSRRYLTYLWGWMILFSETRPFDTVWCPVISLVRSLYYKQHMVYCGLSSPGMGYYHTSSEVHPCKIPVPKPAHGILRFISPDFCYWYTISDVHSAEIAVLQSVHGILWFISPWHGLLLHYKWGLAWWRPHAATSPWGTVIYPTPAWVIATSEV